MRIIEPCSLEQKLKHLPLLLLSDPEEDMVMRYLGRSRMFLLEEEDPLQEQIKDGEAVGAIVIADRGDGVCEIKNLSVSSAKRGQGYGRMLVEHGVSVYEDGCTEMLAGTDRQTVPLFERMGFTLSHVVRGYYTNNYSDLFGMRAACPDLYYLRRTLQPYSVLSIYDLRRERLEKREWPPEAKAL